MRVNCSWRRAARRILRSPCIAPARPGSAASSLPARFQHCGWGCLDERAAAAHRAAMRTPEQLGLSSPTPTWIAARLVASVESRLVPRPSNRDQGGRRPPAGPAEGSSARTKRTYGSVFKNPDHSVLRRPHARGLRPEGSPDRRRLRSRLGTRTSSRTPTAPSLGGQRSARRPGQATRPLESGVELEHEVEFLGGGRAAPSSPGRTRGRSGEVSRVGEKSSPAPAQAGSTCCGSHPRWGRSRSVPWLPGGEPVGKLHALARETVHVRGAVGRGRGSFTGALAAEIHAQLRLLDGRSLVPQLGGAVQQIGIQRHRRPCAARSRRPPLLRRTAPGSACCQSAVRRAPAGSPGWCRREAESSQRSRSEHSAHLPRIWLPT